MLIINPNTIARSDFNSTPSPPLIEPLWLVGTTYVEDYFVRVGDVVYQSLQAANTGNDPTAEVVGSEVWWLEYGVSNPMKPFDGIINSRAVYGGDIVYEINSVDFISGITLLELININNVSVTILDIANATEIYNYNAALPIGVVNLALTDIPLYKNILVTLTLRQNDVTIDAEIGEIIFGKTNSIGITEYGASTGIIDYSTKTQDDFGNFYITARAFSKKSNIKLKVLPGQVDYTVKTLTNLRSTPIVWIINDKTQYSGILVIYGFYKDFKITLPDCAMANMTLNVEGLV